MVRAILAGQKTQTRRAVKPQPQPNGGEGLHPVAPYNTPQGKWTWVLEATGHGDGTSGFWCPYGHPGDRLWVRENCWAHKDTGEIFAYCAVDETLYSDNKTVKKVPSIHMPRSKCRLLLEITNVRIERLQEITEEDAEAEGCTRDWRRVPDTPYCAGEVEGHNATDDFAALWVSINGEESWKSNPWVWVIEFRRIEA